MGLDPYGLDQLLNDMHGDSFISEVYLAVYFVILKIFSVYFRRWVDSFKTVMLLLRIYLLFSFMLFDSNVWLQDRDKLVRYLPVQNKLMRINKSINL